jgi:hypothetical protein
VPPQRRRATEQHGRIAQRLCWLSHGELKMMQKKVM